MFCMGPAKVTTLKRTNKGDERLKNYLEWGRGTSKETMADGRSVFSGEKTIHRISGINAKRTSQ